jgi:MYXO-CTERM domain-containing protein
MKKLLLSLGIAVASIGAWPGGAQAGTWSTCPNIFSVCVQFTLLNNGADNWALTTNYSSGSGMLTATGIYYDGIPAPDLGITNLKIATPGQRDWVLGACNDIRLATSSTVLLDACGSSSNGIPNGMYSGGGGGITITFTANSAFRTAYYAHNLEFRGVVQGYGAAGCSVTLDTGTPTKTNSSGAAGECAPLSANPEPVSMILLASGLGGLALPALRRRRREKHEA